MRRVGWARVEVVKASWIIVIVVPIAIGVPWMMLGLAAAEGGEPDPEFILSALFVPPLTVAILCLMAWAQRRAVLDARARRARETDLPLAALNPLALAAHAALDQGERAERDLREALDSTAVGGLCLEARNRLIGITDRVTKDLPTARRDLELFARPMAHGAYGAKGTPFIISSG